MKDIKKNQLKGFLDVDLHSTMNQPLFILSKEQCREYSGGVSPAGHVLRAISGSALGIAYWIGYLVEKNNS